MIEKWAYAKLSTDAAITAIVGTRIFPFSPPQKDSSLSDFPRVTYFRVSGERGHSLDGPWGLTTVRLQVDSWALRYEMARALADAVRLSLDGYRGSIADVNVQGVFIDSEQDLTEPPQHAEEELVYRVTQDYRVMFEESKRNTP